jgi:hypothetical protein
LTIKEEEEEEEQGTQEQKEGEIPTTLDGYLKPYALYW